MAAAAMAGQPGMVENAQQVAAEAGAIPQPIEVSSAEARAMAESARTAAAQGSPEQGLQALAQGQEQTYSERKYSKPNEALVAAAEARNAKPAKAEYSLADFQNAVRVLPNLNNTSVIRIDLGNGKTQEVSVPKKVGMLEYAISKLQYMSDPVRNLVANLFKRGKAADAVSRLQDKMQSYEWWKKNGDLVKHFEVKEAPKPKSDEVAMPEALPVPV